MRAGNMALEALAVLACYLVLTLPAASAVTVRIHDSTGYVTSATYNPYYMVKKSISINPPWDAPTVDVVFTNSSVSASLQEVVFYRCRGKDPSSCVNTVASASYQGGMSESLDWGSLAEQTTEYPQEARMLAFTRVAREGKQFWSGFWITIERSGQQAFQVSEDSLGSLDLYAEPDYISTVTDFITERFMIPFNPLWVNRIVFGSGSGTHVLGFDEPESASGGEAGTELLSVESNYTAVLAVDSSVRSPVMVYNSPSYMCGNGECESGSGETSANCCLDCPCGQGYYCDASGACRQESGVSLRLVGMPSGINNCFEEHELQATVEVMGPPTGYEIGGAWYTLRNELYSTTCTRLSGNMYTCPVTIPPLEGCQEGTFVLGPNSLGLPITYPDGSGTSSKSLELGLPDVSIGSYTCGQYGCEDDFGEGSGGCCYDCGCPSGYCSYHPGIEPSDARCMPDPGPDDISLDSMGPLHFTGLMGGSGDLEASLGLPEGFSLVSETCSMSCSGVAGCTASCTSSCAGSEGGADCSIMFTIDGYDTENDYTLSPELRLEVEFRNGSRGTVREVLTKRLSQVSVGSRWCGNLECSGDETSQDCCFDCPCPEGEYCYASNIEAPTQGDECRALSTSRLVIDSVGSLELQDSTREQVVRVEGHIPQAPAGLELGGICEIAGGELGCELYCTGKRITDSGYEVECDMHIPPIDYVTEGQPYYDPVDRVLTIPENSFNITVSYNDGPDKRQDTYQRELGEVSITVTSHCGEGGCEEDLGEDQGTCCRDCGCSGFGDGYFCFTGGSPSGECVDNSSILLEVGGFDPEPLGCIIGYIGGPCKFISSVGVNMSIINAPSDIEVLEGIFTEQGAEGGDMECSQAEGSTGFLCAFLPGDLGGEEGSETREYGFTVQTEYTMEGAQVLQGLTASAEASVMRNKSQALENCEEEIERMEERISRLEEQKASSEGYSSMYTMLAILLLVAFAVCVLCMCEMGICQSEGAGPLEGPGFVIEAPQDSYEEPDYSGDTVKFSEERGGSDGVTGAATASFTFCAAPCMPIMTMAMNAFQMSSKADDKALELESQIQQYQAQMEQKQAMCSSESFGQLAQAEQGMVPMMMN